MKLQTQNILVILPIFLGMTCIIGFSRYTAEIHEIRWGLRQEIAGYATSIAAFWSPGEAPEHVLPPADGRQRPDALQTALDRIAVTAAQRLRYVMLYDATGQKPLATWGEMPEGGDATVPSETLALLQQDELVLADLPSTDTTQSLLLAYAPLRMLRTTAESAVAMPAPSKTALAGILLVAMHAGDVQVHAQAIFRQISLQSGTILCLGLLVIMIISTVVSREINMLTQFVASAAADVKYEQSGVLSIEEFSDLGNTFDTMRDVLEESETRLNRLLIQGTQFRSRIDLARVYVEDFWPPLQGRYGHVAVAGGLLGERFTGSFFGVVERYDGFYALVGRIQGSGDLDPVVMASGAWSCIKEDLQQLDLEKVFERVADVFVLEAFMCAHWADAISACRLFTMEPLPPAVHYGRRPFQPPDLMRLVHQYGALSDRQQPFRPDETIAMHTFAGDIAEKIAIYLRRFPQLPPEELLQELAIFLGPGCDGAVVLMRHSGVAP